MSQIMTVFRFTFKDAIMKKSVWISTIIIFVLIGALFAVPRLASAFSGGETASKGETAVASEPSYDETSGVLYYADEAALIPDGAAALAARVGGVRVEPIGAADVESRRATVAEEESASLVTVVERDGLPFVTLTTNSFMNGVSYDGVLDALTDAYVGARLRELGVEGEAAQVARMTLPGASDVAGNGNMGGYVAGLLLTMLSFFAIYYYGYGVSMSIASEKTSRVMETLVVSAKPSRILIGKCLAMGAVGLLQFAIVLAFMGLCCAFLLPEGFVLMGMPLSLSAFTPVNSALILVYFLLGYALYAMMNAVCGASVSKIEDLNSAMMPVMLIALVSFYAGYMSALTSSDGLAARIVTYVPFTSPFVLPFRLLNGEVPASELALSTLFLVIAVALVSALSIRLYSASVLHYGKRLKLNELYGMKP